MVLPSGCLADERPLHIAPKLIAGAEQQEGTDLPIFVILVTVPAER